MPPEPSSQHSLARILIVDDDAGQRSLLDTFLRSQGFQTVTVESGERALEELQKSLFDLMITDVRMPGISGLETMRRARQLHGTMPILLVTAYADVRDAVGAVKDGALDYLAKPIDFDELLVTVRRATHTIPPSSPSAPKALPLPDNVIAHNPVLRAVFEDAALIAASDSRVLITGESGSGKEVLADLIHQWSPRASKPFIKVNCAAIPENLLESELFGHEKGSFTGAFQNRVGRFEEASEGTIFLDEIGEMSPALQAKLLRITQDGQFRRVGSNTDRRSNTRIIAATNLNLEQQVQAGKFREDLFYRLNVVEMHVPPLRERREDILPLATCFLTMLGGGKVRLSAGASNCLQNYSWPGNVRELRNAMERASLLSRGEVILPDHLPSRIHQSTVASSGPVPLDSHRLEDIERDAILQALKENGFNRTETAKALAISRRALVYKLQRLRELGYPIDPP